MKFLEGAAKESALQYLREAALVAKNASCQRSKCGSVIVSSGEVIGEGFNSPVQHLEEQRRCSLKKDSYHRKVTDKTCCMHAEQRALLDALRRCPEKLSGSRLYFIRLDTEEKMSFAGNPYCTVCSKMTLDLGVSEFVLYHKEGIAVYDTQEYNLLSYEFGKEDC